MSRNDEPLTIEEVTEVTDELVETWERLMPQLSRSAALPTRAWLEAIVDSTSMVFVARLDGSLVGSLTLVLTYIPVGLKAWIEDVVVDEKVRGRGIGEALMKTAINRAQNEGVRNINLTSSLDREEANSFYKRLGFEQRETNVYRYKG